MKLEDQVCSLENEIWKSIKGYEGHYEASNTGKIRSLKRSGTKGW